MEGLAVVSSRREGERRATIPWARMSALKLLQEKEISKNRHTHDS
jgi:hypothetical protein